MRIAGIFIIIAILFSYLPMDAMENCSEENHSTNTRMDCGYTFHCPIVFNKVITQFSILPINGWLRYIPTIGKAEELPRFIFHPPKKSFKYEIWMRGMKGFGIFGTMIAYKFCKELII